MPQTLAAISDGAESPFRLATVTLDEPRDDEILVRLVATGICHTDLVFKAAGSIAAPAVFGHEGAGIIEKIGAGVIGFSPGDRVVISFRSCGACVCCDGGNPAYCHSLAALNFTGMRPDGSKTLRCEGVAVAGSFFGQSSFATHALTYARNLVSVPDEFPLALMAPLGCGVQTGAGAILRSLDCETGSSLLISGGGPVGLSAVMAAKIRGCRSIILVEPHQPRRALGAIFGATHLIDPASGVDVAAEIRKILPAGVNYALDTTGLPHVQGICLASLAPRGVLGLIGISAPGTKLPSEVNMVMGLGLSIRGIVEGDSNPAEFIPELMMHYKNGDLPFDKMITTYPFARINQAIAAQHGGACIKAVLLMDGAY